MPSSCTYHSQHSFLSKVLSLSFLVYNILHLAKAIPQDASDTSATQLLSNTTTNLTTTPWPPVPFSVPLPSKARPGELTFDIIGPPASNIQAARFRDFLVLLSALFPLIETHFDFVGVVMPDPTRGLSSFFFTESMKSKPASAWKPTGWDDFYVLKTVQQQVRQHGLNEFGSNIDRSAYVDGGMQLLLEDLGSIPVEDLILQFVPIGVRHFVTEIVATRSRKLISENLVHDIFRQVMDYLSVSPRAKFESVMKEVRGMRLKMWATGQWTQTFTCGDALEVVRNLRDLELIIREERQFDVYTVVNDQPVVVVHGDFEAITGQDDGRPINGTLGWLLGGSNRTVDVFS